MVMKSITKKIKIDIDNKSRSINLTKNHDRDFAFLVIDLNNMENIFHCYREHINIKELSPNF